MAAVVADNDIVILPASEDTNRVRFLANIGMGSTEKDTA
jgi:hypothetical protein